MNGYPGATCRSAYLRMQLRKLLFERSRLRHELLKVFDVRNSEEGFKIYVLWVGETFENLT